MAYINIAEWSPEHVADWLRGLDNMIIPYVHFFLNNRIDGHHLLTLGPDDLGKLNITKIGHQELILEAVNHLRQLHYNLITENLQSLALKVGCHARSLHNEIQVQILTGQSDSQAKKVNTEILAAASELIVAVKQFISWIDRPPFKGQDKYFKIRKTVLQLSLELASTAQRDHFADNPLEFIKQKCLCLAELSDFIVQEYSDSLIIQPASLDVVTAKKSAKDDDWGMQITSKYSGVHIVGSVKYQSPVQLCAKVEEGDEIVQVNYQTVLGWSLDHLTYILQDRKTEVTLTLKKRPRHSNLLGQIICLKPYKIPVNKIGYEKQQLNIPEEGFPSNLEPEPSSPRVLREVEADDDAFLPPEDKATSDQNVVSRLRSQVKNRRTTIQRRATVSGASPTVSKAPVSFEDLVDGPTVDGSSSGQHKCKKAVKDHVTRSISHDPCHGQQSPAIDPATTRRLLTPPLKHTKMEFRKLTVPHVPPSPNLPSPLKKIFASRVVSSESLLPADRHGWLFVRPRSCPKKWHKRWAMLKSSYLYLFKSRHEARAASLIFLPGFSVQSAPECSASRFAFKLEHPTVTFTLAASDHGDMLNWLKKLQEHANAKQHSESDIERNSVMPDQTVYYSESEESNPDSGEEEPGEAGATRGAPTTGGATVSGGALSFAGDTKQVSNAPSDRPSQPRDNPKPKPRTIFLSSTLPRNQNTSSISLPTTPSKPLRHRNSEHRAPGRENDEPKQQTWLRPLEGPPDVTEGMFKKAQQQQAERNKLKQVAQPVLKLRTSGEPTTGSQSNHTPPAIPPRCATSQQIKELYLNRGWGSGAKIDDTSQDHIYVTRLEATGAPGTFRPPPPNKPDILAGTNDHHHEKRI
ncbi:uncharacterized protein LOC111266672 [Varroa jacobsoni]|uniref:Connector enhancer of kinase suppressor of ras 2 n=1 Tax=Varroa destructor TaxID=109461 RepID=A0A7M7KKW2_VARDE|nr:uncharacterized protein LOC111252979 [Varroa destructor]XP_022700093.1 uncharacterized protein LOC111266672 [Varroa jacobsoni]